MNGSNGLPTSLRNISNVSHFSNKENTIPNTQSSKSNNSASVANKQQGDNKSRSLFSGSKPLKTQTSDKVGYFNLVKHTKLPTQQKTCIDETINSSYDIDEYELTDLEDNEIEFYSIDDFNTDEDDLSDIKDNIFKLHVIDNNEFYKSENINEHLDDSNSIHKRKRSETEDFVNNSELNITDETTVAPKRKKRLTEVEKLLDFNRNVELKKGVKRDTFTSQSLKWEVEHFSKNRDSILHFRFAKDLPKYGLSVDGEIIVHDNNEIRYMDGHSLAEKGAIIGTRSPNSKTPRFFQSPTKHTNYKRTIVANEGLAYYKPVYDDQYLVPEEEPIGKKLTFDDCEDDIFDAEHTADTIEKRIDDSIAAVTIPWDELKSSATAILTSNFELGKSFVRTSETRRKSQNTVMGGVSAKDSISNFIKNGDGVIENAYRVFLREIGVLEDGKLKARSLEYRHLAPFAVFGNEGQIPENMGIGPHGTNSMEITIENAAYITAQIASLSVCVKEYVYGDQHVGLFREYIITNKENGKVLEIGFPVLCCLEKPPVCLIDVMKSYMQTKLGVNG